MKRQEEMKKRDYERSLKIAILLTSILFIVEIIGGLISGSLSLLGDAGHMFRDVFAEYDIAVCNQ